MTSACTIPAQIFRDLAMQEYTAELTTLLPITCMISLWLLITLLFLLEASTGLTKRAQTIRKMCLLLTTPTTSRSTTLSLRNFGLLSQRMRSTRLSTQRRQLSRSSIKQTQQKQRLNKVRQRQLKDISSRDGDFTLFF